MSNQGCTVKLLSGCRFSGGENAIIKNKFSSVIPPICINYKGFVKKRAVIRNQRPRPHRMPMLIDADIREKSNHRKHKQNNKQKVRLDKDKRQGLCHRKI